MTHHDQTLRQARAIVLLAIFAQDGFANPGIEDAPRLLATLQLNPHLHRATLELHEEIFIVSAEGRQ